MISPVCFRCRGRLGFREGDTRFDALLEVILRQRLESAHADFIAEHRVRWAPGCDSG